MPIIQLKNLFRLVIILFLVSLSACAPYRKPERDGAPNYYVDVSKIPNAVPRVEPPCRGANRSPYVVLHHRYHVLSSAEGYDKRGIASWYGTLFHKHSTSCGETYNMLAMTAASRDLPLPTFARVTNLENGRWVIVKVNDRGPFDRNRIMDLSWAAAKKLGMAGHGTAYVEVKAIDPRSWNSRKEPTETGITRIRPPLKHPGHPALYLQVGAYSRIEKARSVGRKVANLTHYSVRIQGKPGHSHIFRVQIGPISGGAEAGDSVSRKLKQAGFAEPIHVIE